MAYSETKELIQALEEARNSTVICYVMSDRETLPNGLPGFSALLENEPRLHVIEFLRSIGHVDKLDLFLYTRGGSTDSVWPFVNLLRQYCDTLSVIVPFRAHSAGTLICLGADNVVMTSQAELSPIDPKTGNEFNPVDPNNQSVRYGISVEDVAAYFTLSEERGGVVSEQYKTDVWKELAQQVHPLALGNVQRVYMQIRELATKLLALHLDKVEQASRIDEIVEALTVKFYSHVHYINSNEAMELLGDWVVRSTADEDDIIWNLFNSYVDRLSLSEPFCLREFAGDQYTKELTTLDAIFESSSSSYIHEVEMNILQRAQLPPNVNVQMPPGQNVPLQGRLRTYDFDIVKVGWHKNSEEK